MSYEGVGRGMTVNRAWRPLGPGDRLRVVAPSGTLRERERAEQGMALWRQWGFEVLCPPDIGARWGYLAGEDSHRRQQLQAALTDPDCRGILCVRGGFGGTRLLEQWHWPAAAAGKWLIGFSDITSLLWSGLSAQIIGVHGPLLTTLAAEPTWSQQRLRDLVTGQAVAPLQGQGWGGGQGTGLLLPANLTVATHLLGTAHAPALDGVILALEDVAEAPYRLDRMLTHWRMLGQLSKLKGIALGRFSHCDPPSGVPSFTVAEVLRERLGDVGIPVVAELPFGHDGPNAALPVGRQACLDGDRGTLTLLEPWGEAMP